MVYKKYIYTAIILEYTIYVNVGYYYYLNVFYLVFDLYPFIHTQFDVYPSSAHEISTVSVHK